MYIKLMVLTIGLLAIAAGVLNARHQRAQLTHELMQRQRAARTLQREVWVAQAAAARRLQLDNLRQTIAAHDLRLEPATPPLATPLRSAVARGHDDPYAIYRQP